MNNYEKQADDFLKKTNTKFEAHLIGHYKYFDGDKSARDVYEIVLTRGDKKPFAFKFSQSVNNSSLSKTLYSDTDVVRIRRLSKRWTDDDIAKARRGKPPTPYDVLACLTVYDPGTFEDFCGNYGYDLDSRKGAEVYFDCQKEWQEVRRVFGDVLEQLREIE